MSFCTWATGELMAAYHDEEWGRPTFDDDKLFELLILEGAQAGLSWETVLKRREGYRRVFKGLKIDVCAQMTDEELAAALLDEGIIRHKGKVASVKANALAVQQIQKEHGSFSRFCWSFVNFEPILTRAKALEDLEVTTPSSVSMSKALKKAGLKFCGPTICQSFLQAGGMLNDHVEGCPQRDACRKDWLAADPGF